MTYRATLLLALLLTAVVSAQEREQAQASSTPLAEALAATLNHRLSAVASGLDGVLGYAIIDLTSGETVARRLESEPFPTASTIKLAILYELLKQAQEGRVSLDAVVPLDRRQIVGGTGVLQYLSAPGLPLRDYATLMIVSSDNTATNIVIDTVGMSKVSARMQALGLADVRLRRKMMDSAAAARGDENVAAPLSLARLAGWLWSGQGLSDESKAAARTMLGAVSGAIRNAVPASVPVLSKTGELDGVRAEAAVVEVADRPFALAVMTTYLKNDSDGVRAIAETAQAAFEYFDRLAHGGQYGRRLP